MGTRMNEPVNVKPHRRRPWTAKELQFVEEHYGSLSAGEIATRLGRTAGSIISMAWRLGCNGKQLHWTDDDKAVLTTHYAAGADKASVMAMLPGRTWTGIMSMVYTLGIVRRRWKPEENRILEKYYATEGVRVAERLPGRTSSAVANQAYARKLRHPGRIKWNENELKLLEQNQHLPLKELATFFPRRSRIAVWHARKNLGKRQSGTKSGGD